jgi:2-methylcitrate dehydratase PrpD
VLLAAGGTMLLPADIQTVELRIYQAAIDLLGNIKAATPYLAKFNIPFCAATALRYGHCRLDDFTPARLQDVDLRQIMDKTTVSPDPELTAAYPRTWPARVTITLSNGRQLKAANEFPKGDPENPLSEQELVAKFKGLTEGQLPAGKADEICERVMNLEKIDNVNRLLL